MLEAANIVRTGLVAATVVGVVARKGKKKTRDGEWLCFRLRCCFSDLKLVDDDARASNTPITVQNKIERAMVIVSSFCLEAADLFFCWRCQSFGLLSFSFQSLVLCREYERKKGM